MELILISDIIISTISTTIVDSLCFQKLIIRVIFEESKMKLPFDDFDVVISSTLNQLTSKIFELLKDTKVKEKLLQSGKIFVKKYYNIPVENPKKFFNDLLENEN